MSDNQLLFSEYTPVELSARVYFMHTQPMQHLVKAKFNFADVEDLDGDSANSRVLFQSNIQFFCFADDKKTDDQLEAVIACSYLVQLCNSEYDKQQLVSQLWPYMRSVVILEANMLRLDVVDSLPMLVDSHMLRDDSTEDNAAEW